MLYEIVCDKFISNNQPRGAIIFHKGLNILQGHNTGTNSIGKSTFLLVVDFVFGGDTYWKDSTIIEKIGHHTINFCFIFENEKHYYSRNTEFHDNVTICDENYTPIGEPIKIDNFRNQLGKFYKMDLHGATTFRNIVSRFFRVHGKNIDVTSALAARSGEAYEDSLKAFLQLYDKYEPIKKFNEDLENKKIRKSTLNAASKAELIETISKRETYIDNIARIEELTGLLREIEAHGSNELSDMQPDQAEQLAKYKTEYEALDRKRKRLWVKYYSVKSTVGAKTTVTKEDFDELSKFFPDANIKLLTDIENFHSKLSVILTNEFNVEMRNILNDINGISAEMVELEGKMKDMNTLGRISTATLERYAEIKNEINKLTKINDLYLQQRAIEKDITNSKKNYETLFLQQSKEIEDVINKKISELNAYIYGDSEVPPELIVKSSNSYTYETHYDKGTATIYKNIILYDLTALSLTMLPAIAHDSVYFKQIAQAPMGKILQLYSQYDKQIFIAIDETLRYPEYAQKIIEDNTIIRLSGDGNELFGSSWNIRESVQQLLSEKASETNE